MVLTLPHNRQDLLAHLPINTDMNDPDSQEFLDSVMVIERETVPVEFYGNPDSMFNTTGTVERIKNSTYVEVPADVISQLNWASGDSLQWDVIDQETVVITKKRK